MMKVAAGATPAVLTGILATAGACLLGCTSGFLHDAASGSVHEYRMDIGSVRYVRSVSGTYAVNSLLCIISLGHGRYMHAMEDLMENAHLAPNEILDNVRQDESFDCYLLVGSQSLTVSADVYAVTPAASEPAQPAVASAPPPPMASPPPPPAHAAQTR